MIAYHRKNKNSRRRTKREKRSAANYRVSLKAIIRNQKGEVLMVRGIDRTWTLPGGGIEHGETDITALKRELLEEVAYKGDLEARPVAPLKQRVEVLDSVRRRDGN